MPSQFITILAVASATLASAASIRATTASASTTPHEQYSSSVGVLGCKIDTNRVAYWPMSVSCEDICVKVSYQGRSVDLLRIDQSSGAYDISYNAYNFLVTRKSAKENPITGGGVAMDYETVPADNCRGLIRSGNGGLPLSGANSMNYLSSCLSQPNSWVARNHELRNILNPTCTRGFDEVCTLDLAKSNQASCPHALGTPNALTSAPVYNVQYGTGKEVLAP